MGMSHSCQLTKIVKNDAVSINLFFITYFPVTQKAQKSILVTCKEILEFEV